MTSFGARLALCVALSMGVVSQSGCGGGEEEAADDGTKPKKEKKKKKEGEESKKSAEGKAGPAVATKRVSTLAPRTFKDSDFVESEHNRDPFRSLMVELAKTAKAPVTQRKVLMPNTPIASLRLIAIVTGIAQPRAMIVDEKGVGYVA